MERGDVVETLADVRTKVDRAIEDVEAALRSTVEGTLVLEDLGTYLLEAGGKRLRPQLMIGCYLAAGGKEPQRPVQLAAAFELIHTASLVHDDIIDDPTLRRRRPAPHRRYGIGRALVAGDFLFAKAFELISREDYRVASAVADAAVAMAEGEHLELMRSYDATVTEAQYEEVMEKKTASLMRASARVAAMLAEADIATTAALEDYARRVGLAFQIVDDVLDLEPSAALTGKPSGMDLREGRMTSVLLAAIELLEGEERELVVRVFTAQSPPQADVDRALAHVRSTGAGGVALSKAHAHVEAAIATLPQTLPGPAREYLAALAMEVANRRA